MKKQTVSFVCQECGYVSSQWLGKCPECGSWNSLREFKNHPFDKLGANIKNKGTKNVQISAKTLAEISSKQSPRLTTGFTELDTVLGGGVVDGAVMLLAGDPGVGKSTLLLQLGLFLAKQKKKVLYVSGEESEDQIKLRAARLTRDLSLPSFRLVSLTDTDNATLLIKQEIPDIAIVDSIQTMESENLEGLSGSVSQVRFATGEFIRLAKQNNIPIILVGHVTKEGMVAGPMVLSHMVDVVLLLEGQNSIGTRILRSLKNRFGPVDEVGVFTMDETGIVQVQNPQGVFVQKHDKKEVSGSVLVVTLEGSRAFLVEIQALAVFSKLPLPRRVASGVDPRRLEVLLAVLQKHCSLNLSAMDVYVNVAGGLRISDPAADLGICMAIFSSLKNIAISNAVGIAEVGLLGELREVTNLEKRIKEAKKLGAAHVFSAKTHKLLQQALFSLA
ncbi:MAG: DNA repair protein RadA [Candidatus Levybacteria bacterium]|nr:DNA repair protein RadA [Candidatus Levybacteria bacterium]